MWYRRSGLGVPGCGDRAPAPGDCRLFAGPWEHMIPGNSAPRGEPPPLLGSGFVNDDLTELREDSPGVPPRALVLSLLALAIPVLGATIAPEWLAEDPGVLLWLTALVPPFLLAYYRGWQGASLGLAFGMVVLVSVHLVLILWHAPAPAPTYPLLLWVTGTYIAVCVGAGVLGELLRRERADAEAMALTDALTGLPNRRHATIFLNAAFAAAIRGQPTCVVLFDFDHFKKINDRHGHRAGDEALKRFGRILTEQTRRMNLSARWGGEEFISILSQADPDGAAVFTRRVRDRLREEQFPWGTLTVSAGIAAFGPAMGSPEVLVAAADRALYAAKAAGRDCQRIAEREPLGKVDTVGDGAVAGGATNPRPAGLPRGTERILVVDDDEPVRRGVARFLSELGYQVVEAPDGPTAMEVGRRSGQTDLLLTDLIMPRMMGFSLGEQFEEELGPQRILYMSGHVQGEVNWRWAPGSVVEFISKPITGDVLAHKVRGVLDRSL